MNEKWDYKIRYPDDEPPPRKERTVQPAAAALGCVGTIALVVVGVVIAVQTSAAFALLLGLCLTVFAIVLTTQRDPTLRGLGVGMLIALGISLLLVGSCLALIAGAS